MGGFDALVGEHLRYSVDVRAECDLQCGKGVAEAVERDVFADAGGLHPGVEWVLNHTAAQPYEHYALVLHLTAQF